MISYLCSSVLRSPGLAVCIRLRCWKMAGSPRLCSRRESGREGKPREPFLALVGSWSRRVRGDTESHLPRHRPRPPYDLGVWDQLRARFGGTAQLVCHWDRCPSQRMAEAGAASPTEARSLPGCASTLLMVTPSSSRHQAPA